MTRILALALAALLPAAALGQEAAPELQTDPRVAKFRDVERGFFVGFEAGYLSLLDTPTKNRVDFPYAGKSGGRAGGLLVTASVGVVTDVAFAASAGTVGFAVYPTVRYTF